MITALLKYGAKPVNPSFWSRFFGGRKNQNKVCQHYLEHARHKWLLSLGLDFDALHKQGIDLVVVRIEIDYRFPLRSRDRFVVRSYFQREGRLRIICNQDIYKIPDDRLVAQAKLVATGIQNGRPAVPPEIGDKIDNLLEQRQMPDCREAPGMRPTGAHRYWARPRFRYLALARPAPGPLR